MSWREFSLNLPGDQPGPEVSAALQGPVPAVLLASIREVASEHVDTGSFLARLTLVDTLRYPFMGSPLSVAIVSPDEYGDYLERGHAGFHLATRWGARGGQWKVSAEGKLYARVAFRQRTPGDVSGGRSTSRARTMMQALSLGKGGRLTGFGDLYRQSKSYRYYRAAGQRMPEHLRREVGYTWKSSAYEGLFRVTAPTPAGGRHTSYVTIRTITPDSPGWWIPPAPPLRLFERGLDAAASNIKDILEQAATLDMEHALDDVIDEL